MTEMFWLTFALLCGFVGFITGALYGSGWKMRHPKERERPKAVNIIDKRTPEQIAWTENPDNHGKAWRE